MVSSEGACAAYYLYRRLRLPSQPRRRRPVAEPVSDGPHVPAARLRRLDLPAAAARQPARRDGPRRRRPDVGRTGRAPLRARPSAASPCWRPDRLGGGHARRRPAGVLHRHLRGPAAVLPRRVIGAPGGQRHRQRPGDERGAGRATCPAASSWRRAPSWRSSAGSPRTCGAAARRPGSAIVTGDTKVVDAGHGDGCTSTPPASAWCPPGSTSARSGRGRAT